MQINISNVYFLVRIVIIHVASRIKFKNLNHKSKNKNEKSSEKPFTTDRIVTITWIFNNVSMSVQICKSQEIAKESDTCRTPKIRTT